MPLLFCDVDIPNMGIWDTRACFLQSFGPLVPRVFEWGLGLRVAMGFLKL